MTIEMIVISASLALVFILLLKIVQMYKRSREITQKNIALEVERDYVLDLLEKLIEEQDRHSLEKTDGFLKFVSDSREWAFAYIEDVQESLDKFDKRISHIINYYSTYGSTIDGLHVDMVKQVSEAYDDLKSKLPKEDSKV